MRAARTKPKRRFVLTPLVDVIFLLVIFFALSSRIAPYVLIPVAGPGTESESGSGHSPIPSEDTSADQHAAAPPKLQTQATLVLAHGHVRIGPRIVALGDLAVEATSLITEGIDTAVVVTSRSAVTEDVAQALQALKKAGIAEVRLIARPAPPTAALSPKTSP